MEGSVLWQEMYGDWILDVIYLETIIIVMSSEIRRQYTVQKQIYLLIGYIIEGLTVYTTEMNSHFPPWERLVVLESVLVKSKAKLVIKCFPN